MTRRSLSFTFIGIALLGTTGYLFWDGVDRRPLDRLHPDAHPRVDRDLKAILADTLRVLVLQDPLTWEPVRSGARGLEWELLQGYAADRGIPVRAVRVPVADSLLSWLQQGRGDVVAAQLSEGDPRTLYMKLTRPYRRTAPVLLHHVPKDPDGRSGYADTVRMAWRSPFGGRAAALGRAINGSVLVTDSDQTEQDLFVDVALGRLDQAIVSEARAGCLGGQFPHLRVTEPLARSAALVFGVRSNARKLLGSLNAWLRDAENAEPITEIVAAYSGRPYAGKLVRSPRPALHGAGISPFDSTFRKHAAMMSFDWRLLAAVAFGESGFDPTAVSHKGAFGLMQMMPGTAGRLGLDSLDLIDQQVKGAAMYLAILDSMWMRRIPDQEERLNFVLASYNAGPGHVLDAVRLAPGLGLDPGRWEEHVERAMLLLALPEFYLLPEVELGPARGSDTFLYVRQVRHVFRYYLTLEPIEQGADTLARS